MIHYNSLLASSTALQKQYDTLLVLLGEKEEELQLAVGDNKEGKIMYQKYIQVTLCFLLFTIPQSYYKLIIVHVH